MIDNSNSVATQLWERVLLLEGTSLDTMLFSHRSLEGSQKHFGSTAQ